MYMTFNRGIIYSKAQLQDGMYLPAHGNVSKISIFVVDIFTPLIFSQDYK